MPPDTGKGAAHVAPFSIYSNSIADFIPLIRQAALRYRDHVTATGTFAMLPIATPHLSPAEWHDVQAMLTAVADCGCGEPAAAGSLRSRLSHAVDAIIGPRKNAPAPIPDHLRPVRDFLCETGRTRRIAPHHVSTLAAQGFSRAQIDALALLGA